MTERVFSDITSGFNVQRFRLTLLLVCLALFAGISSQSASAAPVQAHATLNESYQSPDWMSQETASRLAVGIDVYAPPAVPAPFGGEPEVQAFDGYYGLYWQIAGAPPTFLRVTGELGGVIPDFSYYDRNIQLQQNATVQGYPAYHDLSPIYDTVYWSVGDVVYTVESHNLVSDDSLSLANSLMYVAPPEPAEGGSTTGVERVFTIGVPPGVQAGEIAAIGVDGEGDVLLTAQDGYFPATGENTVVVSGGSSIDWEAPYYESDTTLFFYVYDIESGTELASSSTALEGYLSEGETVVADVQCPPEASAGKQARIAVTGNGTIMIYSTDGVWPVESPNTEFQPDAEGGQSLVGTLPDQASATLSWLAPATTGTVYVSVSDLDNTVLDECGIEVVTTSVSGDLGAPATNGNGSLVPGDGTGVLNVNQSVVLRAIANPTGFAGDASGGPEANGPDYGLAAQQVTGQTAQDADDEETASAAAPTDEESANTIDETELGPSTGAGGMIAIGMNRNGGSLENAEGAKVIVPAGALTDQTTVMIKPVDDHELPEVDSITLIPGTAFDVSFSEADGRSVGELNAPAMLTISLKSAGTGQGARIYRIDGSTVKPMPVVADGAGSVTTEVTELSRYVIGVPAAAVTGSTRTFNPFIVGGLALLALVSAGLLISRGLQRRKTRIIPVHRPAPSRVRYR
ncbi:hypothetical protein BH23CHL4_BH23CHL4_03890 [soil metagenome]